MSLWCHFWTFGQTCFLFLIRNIVFLFLFCWTNTCCQNIQNHFEFTYYLPYQSVSDTLTFLFNTPVIRLLYSSGFFLYRLDFNVPRVFAFFNLCIHTWTNYSCWTQSVVKLLLVIIVDFCNLKVDTIILHKEHFKNKLENKFIFYFCMVCSVLHYDYENLPELLQLHILWDWKFCDQKHTGKMPFWTVWISQLTSQPVQKPGMNIKKYLNLKPTQYHLTYNPLSVVKFVIFE